MSPAEQSYLDGFEAARKDVRPKEAKKAAAKAEDPDAFMDGYYDYDDC